ncbi:MAG: ABC transporter permease [Desulfurococcales archaeon]|nr:ABC transporter permease [Desulfurococcales archaeon]
MALKLIEGLLRAPGGFMTVAGASIIVFFTAVALAAPFIAPYPPDVNPPGVGVLEPPSLKNPFGTNELGYDVFSRVVWGARVVLQVVVLSSIISLLVGVPLGLVSGYYGGPIDRLLSMVMDSLYAFPGIILAIAVASVLGPSVINAAIALMVIYVPTYYRMTRARVLELKSEPFIEALQAMGTPDRLILARHILPNVAPTILVVFGLAGADAILTEAGLSFFGLVTVYPTPDWGLDLYYGKNYLLNGAWWLVFFPGAAILTLALGFALLGEGLSERFKVRGE